MRVYAHTKDGCSESEWQPLEDHLRGVAEMAARFAARYGAETARVAGLWHDLGKFNPDFQANLYRAREEAEQVDHSIVGAAVAWQKNRHLNSICRIIAGHHAGLADTQDLNSRLALRGLENLDRSRAGGLPESWIAEPLPQLPDWIVREPDQTRRLLLQEMWIRFVFSALIDADRLDTEQSVGWRQRPKATTSLHYLHNRLTAYLARKEKAARATALNRLRARIQMQCRIVARRKPGVFSLTVPTGGGKTLASLLFGLCHAIRWKKDRVIVVAPYTTIIDQTVATYREAVDRDNVIEHHSSLDPAIETPLNRCVAENWDAPLIVTTGVQFFETLFASRASRCRKLHNIANSVVILDEAQTFPPTLLSPMLDAVNQLRDHYGVSLVFSTATQPALRPRRFNGRRFRGVGRMREIVTNPASQFAIVRNRCRYTLPRNIHRPVSWETLAGQLVTERQVLVVVDRRRDACELAQRLGDDCFHLSTRMCSAHRMRVLVEIRRRLATGMGCRVVSTQLIEAGVDISFPVVYRALGGVDSIAQAAGRCNREALPNTTGRVVVFVPPQDSPGGALRRGRRVTEEMLREGRLDLVNPATFTDYFQRLYANSNLDARQVMQSRLSFNYATTAARFVVVHDAGESVLAPYGEAAARLRDLLREETPSRNRMRRLQPYMVNLFPNEIRELEERGVLERMLETFWVVRPGNEEIYDQRFGFQPGERDEPGDE